MTIPRILLWLALLHAAVPLVSGQDASQTYSQVVKVYDDGNFEEEVQNGMHVVNFYAPWCGHCKRLVPVWNSLALEVLKRELPVHIARVDVTLNPQTGQVANIKGFPTLKFYRDGVPTVYSGERTREKLLAWILEKSKNPASTTTGKAASTTESDTATPTPTKATEPAKVAVDTKTPSGSEATTTSAATDKTSASTDTSTSVNSRHDDPGDGKLSLNTAAYTKQLRDFATSLPSIARAVFLKYPLTVAAGVFFMGIVCGIFIATVLLLKERT